MSLIDKYGGVGPALTVTTNEYVASVICRLIHYGDYDKGGVPYHLHPEAVARMFSWEDMELRTIAYLHDTVEDHPEKISIEFIREFFGDEIANAIDAISKRKNETYKEYINRVKQNELAKAVKVADLKHNMKVERLPNGGKGCESLFERYSDALKYLSE